MVWFLPFRMVLSAFRLIRFLIGTVIVVSAHIVREKLTGSLEGARLWHAFCCWNFNIHVKHIGTPAHADGRTVLFTPNHISYIDIPVIGAILKHSIFVAKGEVRGWPLFGWLATLQKTVFIKRVRTAMEEAMDDVRSRIAKGYNIILFPEGTTGEGDHVLPFKAGLFELAYAQSPRGGMLVQPIAIVVESINGVPATTQALRDYYAWWRKEDTLLPHLIKLGSIWRTDISVHYLDPLDPNDFPARKDLSQAAEDAVRGVVGIRR